MTARSAARVPVAPPHTRRGTDAGTVPPSLRSLAVACLVVPQALALAVQGVAPLLLREAPFVLLAVHPFEPWSLLVSTRTDPVPFFAVVVAVRAVPCFGDYLAGRWYGPQALVWMSRRPRGARLVRIVQRQPASFDGAVLLLYPGATASVLAGARGLPARVFLPLMLTGIGAAAALARLVAAAATGPLTAVASALDRWAVPAGLALLALVLLSQLRATPREED